MKKNNTIESYIDAVKTSLTNEYGTIKPEWYFTLNILRDQLYLYDSIKSGIEKHGIYNPETGAKSPLLASLKDCTATILKLSQKLGCSPWDSSKIKNKVEDDTVDFVSELMG